MLQALSSPFKPFQALSSPFKLPAVCLTSVSPGILKQVQDDDAGKPFTAIRSPFTACHIARQAKHSRTVHGYTVSGEMGALIASSQKPEAILRLKKKSRASLKPFQAFSSLFKPFQAFSSLFKPFQAFSSFQHLCITNCQLLFVSTQ